MLRRSAGWLANRSAAPTAVRAVFGYYAHSGTFDYGSLRLKRRVNDVTEEILRDAYVDVEEAIAESFGYGYVSFEYDTKLVLPAKLTLGYLYRRLPEDEHTDAEEITRLAVEALIDGDMRDALNDEEFDDFEVDFRTDADDDRQIAEIAQEVLQARVEEQLSRYPEGVREIYDWAVEISERHQDEDEHFRELMARVPDDNTARDAIREEYKFAEFDDEPALFTEAELSIPYLKTQYDRVGIIYEGMIDMYREAGFDIEPSFTRSIVLAIIGAQIWLDDIDDYEADMRDGQLTPVTAEYLLEPEPAVAYESIVEISEQYLDRARTEATAADSTLTGIATEYIYRDGDPDVLPGSKD